MNSGLDEVMCKELTYAVEEIQTDLEQASYIFLQTTEKSTA